ncbi:hypothetical protein [Suttonella ornithocola]|uniref:Aldose 1-epimerase n=1 Tax=Suttonella ornithocola TaxID=279832 RepID=A0A380MMD4_9GAMM|nr:hypothetical protein [Suttonella ornithocola]SUO93344.1 Aldose 1-epimerase [Suttonella ornithocola]
MAGMMLGRERRVPLLFPIVGKFYEDSFRHAGISYAMRQHGFARDSQWKLIAHTSESCCFMLEASVTTHKNYPFVYRLEMETWLKKNTILTQYCSANLDSTQMLYASIVGLPKNTYKTLGY